MKKSRQYLCVAMCMLLFLTCAMPVHAETSVRQQTVRVGFFESEGYHMMDSEEIKSGYGYDFLQMILRYNDWKYEYIGYEKNWGDMLNMLDNDEIDLVTLANMTPERLEKYDYSSQAIGTSCTIMTMKADNSDISIGDYSTYDGMKIGLVDGSSHNEKFEEYAAQKGFTYTPVYYDNIDDLLKDLRQGVNIDIAVTSNMRKVTDEIILDEFNSTEYYAIVKKGNEKLLEELNSAIMQLDVYSPGWRNILFQKYYSNINESVIALSVEEREYLQELKNSGQLIKVAMNPELKPYSYFEDGEAKGIAPEIFKEIAAKLDLQYEILESENRFSYKEQLNSGEADVDLTAFLDYSVAQKYNLKETDAYMTSSIAMLSRQNASTSSTDMIVATVADPTEYVGFNQQLIYQYNYKEYDSIQGCIDAVARGEADATFLYVYIAEQAVQKDYKNVLQYNILQDYAFGLCLGVINSEDHRLLSVLNKSINSLDDSLAGKVIIEESRKCMPEETYLSLAYKQPYLVVGIAVFLLLVIFAFCLLCIRFYNQRKEILASMERDRFVSYICESCESILEVNLKSNEAKLYEMNEGRLITKLVKYEPYDRQYFKDKVLPEDLDRITEAFAVEKIDQMLEKESVPEYLECKLKDSDGQYFWHSYLIKAIARDSKHPKNFIVFKKNIHKSKQEQEESRKALEDALEVAKAASQAKGTFMSRMSHEIRTPLNAVIGYMEIARDSGDNPEKMMHCVENSELAAKHLLSIINDVLDISSIESGKMKIANEDFDLKEQLMAISTIFYHQAAEKKVEFEVVINQVTQEWVVGDSLRLNQILMNLLSNAVKFTPEGGKVTLTVTQVNVDGRKVYMVFEVSDTGIGMSEEYKSRLFQPFEQESALTAQKYGGTGLGLSITNNLIHMMGGSIDVKTKLGEGTTFSVSLHFEKSEKMKSVSTAAHDYSHVRVLIVDDDEAACEYMQSLLKRCGVKSDVVESGEAAVKQIKRRMGSDYKYDMCIMDLNMPGMNGIETARKIKEECDAEIPIIVATAYDITEYEDQAKEIGIKKIIAKPLFQSTMFDLLVYTYGKYEPIKENSESNVNLQGMKVLLAEDNPMNLEIACEILKKAGLIVEAVTDGEQAVARFTESEKGTYDVILMDVQMPVMDGYQATGAIRQSMHPEAKSIPIIAMTANAFAEDVNAALASGMNGHISKPIEYAKLYRVLNECREKAERGKE